MSQIFNIYCDESCHLEHDGMPVMVLGAVWCPLDNPPRWRPAIREIKTKHGLATAFEVKWTKVSPGKLGFYTDLLDYFFEDDRSAFPGALIVPDKYKLQHDAFGQDARHLVLQNVFDLLKMLLSPQANTEFTSMLRTRIARKKSESCTMCSATTCMTLSSESSPASRP